MGFEYTWGETALYLALYAFLGWAIDAVVFAMRKKRFFNRGFLNLPMRLSCGVTAVLLLHILPTVRRNLALQGAICFAAVSVVNHFADLIAGRAVGLKQENTPAVGSSVLRYGLAGLEALLYLSLYLVVHPVIHAVITLLPDVLVHTTGYVLFALIMLDGLCVRLSVIDVRRSRIKQDSQRLAGRISRAVWQRLEREYPGVNEPDELLDGSYIFAEGICFDKLAWVFLISSFLGALIEMAYCFITGGGLISRSSVVFGAFSFVWGFGAVVLTVTLKRMQGKKSRDVFLAGMLIGGVYEYACSVFTERVFGTVFWDYSHMALSIGGRTNAVYCIFWGILAVVWIKALYPLMSRTIERIPPLPGKILTWALVIVMTCNGLVTSAAMLRYLERHQADAPARGAVRRMLDMHYDDAWMEERWPNMVLTGDRE